MKSDGAWMPTAATDEFYEDSEAWTDHGQVGPSCCGDLRIVRTRIVDTFAMNRGARFFLLGVLGLAKRSLDPLTH